MSRNSATPTRRRLLARLRRRRDELEQTAHPVFTARRPPPAPVRPSSEAAPPHPPPSQPPDIRVHDDQLSRAGMPKPPLTPSQALALARQGPEVLKRRSPES